MKDLLVSISIPAYKATFLKRAIASALNQTYQNIELIVVNDKSPEDITSIVESFQDNRIQYYINDENIGGKDPVANWNKCLSYAKGEYFSLLCDDDVYEPDFIESMIELALKYPDCNVFRSRVCIIDQNDYLINFYPSAPEWETSLDYMWHRVSGFRRQTISEFMYRRKPISELGGYIPLPMAWCADDVSIYVFSKQGGIATGNEMLVKFRWSGLNIGTHNDKNILEKIEAQNLYSKWIVELLIDANENYRNIIQKVRIDKEREIMTGLLTDANWRDFLFLFRNRNTDKYFIRNRSFYKAIYQKIANGLKK